jgi:transcriptional regulator with XRE-family HTH domain
MTLTDKEKRERSRFNVAIGNHIRKKRLEKKVSAAELARLCFMDKPNLLRIEKGRINASIYVLNKIAEALEITLEELFKGFKR